MHIESIYQLELGGMRCNKARQLLAFNKGLSSSIGIIKNRQMSVKPRTMQSSVVTHHNYKLNNK